MRAVCIKKMVCSIPIRISYETKSKLTERKRYKKESYDEVIANILKYLENKGGEIKNG